jgi:hypothetical protein
VRIALSIVVALLAGCTLPANVRESVQLGEGQGLIVYEMSCGEHIAWGQFLRSGKKSGGTWAGFDHDGVLRCQEGLQSQRIDAGQYYVGNIGWTSVLYLAERDALAFTVTPGKLTYLGHIQVPSYATGSGSRLTIVVGYPIVRDESDAVRRWLEDEKPALRRYELVKALAKKSGS